MADLYRRSGSETPVNATFAGVQSVPAITRLTNGNYVVVWRDDAATDARGQIFSETGVKVGGEFLLHSAGTGTELAPKVAALSDGGFVAVWGDTVGDSGTGGGGATGIHGQRFNAAGAPLGEFQANTVTIDGAQSNPAVAGLETGRFVITWTDPASSNEIKAAIFAADGTPELAQIAVTAATPAQNNSTVSMLDDGGFVIAWTNGANVLARVYEFDGAPVGTEFVVSTSSSVGQVQPSITALVGGGFVVTWTDQTTNVAPLGYEIRARIYDADNLPEGNDFVVNGRTLLGQQTPSVAALTTGGFVIAWDDASGQEGETNDNGSRGVKAQVYDTSGVAQGPEFLVNTTVAQNQITPVVIGLANGGFAVSWQDSGGLDGNGAGIITQTYEPFDAPITDLVASTTTLSETPIQNNPVATLTGVGAVNASFIYTLIGDTTGGAFAIRGNQLFAQNISRLDFETAPSPQVTVQVTDQNGHSYDETLTLTLTDAAVERPMQASDDILVNTLTAGLQTQAEVAALRGGGFIVVWTDTGVDAGNIKAQAFDDDGDKVGLEFKVNTTDGVGTTASQTGANVAGLDDGGFIVTWTHFVLNGSELQQELRGQFFNADGSLRGAELLIGTPINGSSALSVIAVTDNGDVVVSWRSGTLNTPSGQGDVFARIYAPDGTDVKAAFAIANPTGNQGEQSIVATDDGGFVVAWRDDVSPGTIKMRFYDSAYDPRTAEIVVNTQTANIQQLPNIARLSNGNYVVTWTSQVSIPTLNNDVHHRIFDANGTAVTGELETNVPAGTIQNDSRVVALDNGEFVIFWSDNSSSGPANVIGQRFGADGLRIGQSFLASQEILYAQNSSGVASLGGDRFVYLWGDSSGIGGDLSNGGIKVRIFDTVSNDPPVLTDLAIDLTVAEGDAPTPIDVDVTFTDSDDNFDGGTLVVSGVLAEDVVAITDTGANPGEIGLSGPDGITYGGTAIGTYTGGGGSDLEVTFNADATAAAIEALIESLTYSNTSDAPTESRTFSVTVTDAASDQTSQDIEIDVTPVNDVPVNSIPAPQTIAEDTTLVFSVANSNAITVADADADSATVTVQLSSQSLNLSPRGILTLAGTTGITFVSGADGTGEMEISGTAANINAALDGLSYTPRADLHDDMSIGSDQLRVATIDTGTPALVDVDYVTIEVTAADDTTPGTLTIDEDSGPQVIDALANTSFEDPTRVIQNASADYGRVDVDDNGTADPNDDTIVYTPDTDFNGVDVIRYYVFAGESQEEGTVTVTVNGINDAPVFGRTPFDMQIVSVSDAGESANQNVYDVSFSTDGRYVVFASAADNLVTGDTNGSMDIFVRDLVDDTTTRYSTSTSGVEGNNDSYLPSLSPDGTLLVFSSSASDLVADDTNGADDLFLKDLGTGVTTRLVAENGDEPDSSSSQASFSPDGTKILFVSSATNLVLDDNNGVDDVFVLTIATGAIERVSTDLTGAEVNRGSAEAVWSPDGASIAFSSYADNLVAGDINGAGDVFVKNLATGEVTRVSTDESGLEADGRSNTPVFSPDGTSIAFVSRAGNLLAPGEDTNGSRDIFLKNLTTGEIRRVSVDGNGVELGNDSHSPAFSPDGTHIAFISQAPDVVPGDVDNQDDLFVVDLSDGSIVLVGDPASSDDFDGDVGRAAFSPDGSQILFTSDDGGLATPDTSGKLRALLATLDPQNAAFAENGPSVQVVPVVSLTDDGDNYGGGTLTVAITAGSALDDELTLDIPSTSTGVGLERASSDLFFDGTLIGALGGTPSYLEITFTADATDAAVARLAEAVRFANIGDNPTTATRTVTFTLVDGGGTGNGGSDTSTFDATVAVTVVNDAPTLDLDVFDFTASGNDAALAWTEGDGPVSLAPYAVFDDVDGDATFPNATLTVAITDNASSDDQLTILSVGNGPGEIRIDGNDIYYEATLVGSFTGGDDGNPLVATFNADACHCSIQTVMDSIAFEVTSATPSTDQRTVTFTLNDGGGTDNGGADSATAQVFVDVATSDTAPKVLIDATGDATEQVALDLKGLISVSDVDTTGDVTVTLTVDTGVLHVEAGGSGVDVDDTFSYEVILTGTIAEIQALLGSDPDSVVTYTADSDYPPPDDELTVTIDDGSSSTSDSETITIIAVNDAPDLDLDFLTLGDDTSVTYAAGDPPAYLSFYAEIDDDNENWDDASLTVTIAGATSDDQLSIDFTGDNTTGLWINGSNIYFDGVIVGTFTGGDNGNPLTATFNEFACACAVEEVTYGILYENSGTITTYSSRAVTFAYDDGQGGSDSAVSTLNMSPSIDEPQILGGDPIDGDEDTAIAITGYSVSDDGTDPATGLLTVHLAVEHGTLTVRTDVTDGVEASQISGGGNGSSWLTVTASPDAINATLAALDGLTYRGDADFNGSDVLRVDMFDGGADAPVLLSPLPPPFPLGIGPVLAMFDLDGDGLDEQLFGIGDETDGAIIIFPFGGVSIIAGPNALAFADLSGDTFGDLVYAASDGPTGGFVAIYDDFAGESVIGEVANATGLALADFNGDGQLDVATTDPVAGQVAVILQDFTPGDFLAPVLIDVNPADGVVTVRAGDFDGDGKTDLIVAAGDGTVALLRGLGTGSFVPPATVADAGDPITAMEVADLNGDGVADLVVASGGGGRGFAGVKVLLGNGDGTFGPPDEYATGNPGAIPRGIALGDLNGDGRADIVVANGDDPGTVSILPNLGDGTFGAATVIDTEGDPRTLALGDPDDDGDIDLIVGSFEYGGVEAFNNDTWHRGVTGIAAITVNAVNDAPVLTVQDTTVSGTEDANLVFDAASLNAITVADVDNISLEVTLTVLNGVLTLAQTAGLTFTGGDGADDVTMTFTGSAADINAALEGLVYRGGLNYEGPDTLSVLVDDGDETDSADIAITLADDGKINGDSGSNVLIGTPGPDSFRLEQGGVDTVSGLGGNDGFYFGAAFTSKDSVDGGDGDNDQIGLQGDYTDLNALELAANTITNVEVIAVLPGFDYDITTIDANLSGLERLTIFGGNLGPDDNLTFNGSAESTGSFKVYGGRGIDIITTGGGNDGIYFGPNKFDPANDRVNGGTGTNDQMALDGDYAITLDGTAIQNIDVIALLKGIPGDLADYNLTLDASLVGLGQAITIWGMQLQTVLTVNGSAVAGDLKLYGGALGDSLVGGAGDDWLWGGAGADSLTGGNGADTFVYESVLQSRASGLAFDRLIDFDDSVDKIDLPNSVSISGFAGPTAGLADAANLSADLQAANGAGVLGLGQAVVFTANDGDLIGRSFLLIDANGTAGYQASGDFLIELVNPTTPIDQVGMFI